MSAVVTLKKGEGRTIKAGGAWIFDNEIDTVMGSFENGEIVVVHDFDGYPMGKGYPSKSWTFTTSPFLKVPVIVSISLSKIHAPPAFIVRPSPFFNVTIV